MQLPQFLQDFLAKGPVGAKKGLDAVATTSERGIWALKWSFIGLAITSLLQSAGPPRWAYPHHRR